MCKSEARLFKWGYVINGNENEAENENRSSRQDINRPRRRHGHKYTKCKMCLSVIMVICINTHLSHIWSSIHEKV